MERTKLDIFVKDLCEYVWEVGKRQKKFQFMENTLLEMEKARMIMFFENDVSDEDVEEKVKNQPELEN